MRSCAIGNSSSFVRDASFFGTPVVLVGDRQDGREIDTHVTPVRPTTDEIEVAIRSQLDPWSIPTQHVVRRWAGIETRIATALVSFEPYVQKRLDYVDSETRWN